MTDQFTYVSVLLSIVIALALTHLLAGIATILRARVEKYSFVHIAWIAILLFSCVDYWFSIWGLRASEQWSLIYVSYLLALATMLFVSCQLIMPDLRAGESIDLVAFNQTNRQKYLAAYFCYIALAVIANLTIAGFAAAVLINVVTLVLIAAAWQSTNPRVQALIVGLMVILYAYYALTFVSSL
jgi:hypothetical protein